MGKNWVTSVQSGQGCHTEIPLDNILVSRSSSGEELDNTFIQFGLDCQRAAVDHIFVIRSSAGKALDNIPIPSMVYILVSRSYARE
jgi:hypothetical protein